jgi:2,4-dienoyl-CoA reductase-like NADH-dependent reductase (Old Yellow Enzyme family)/thioredoxin reductase
MPFEHLFSPLRVGSKTAKNRLMMPAMSINFGVDERGHVTDQLTHYFVARARGGTGILLVGGGAVDPSGLELPHLPMLWDDHCIDALQTMTRQVTVHGALFGMQLMHGGRQSYHDGKVAPSPLPAPAVVKGVPRELTQREIQQLVTAFGDAALRCRKGGFDLVEIHAAHGYLINQFLSPNANQRTDRYGGSFTNRIRFALEVFWEIKAKAGDDFPVGVRMNGEDYIENGWGLEEALELAKIFQREGADYLHISAGVYGSSQLTIPSMYVPAGCFVHLAAAVKEQVSIPVVAVGRIKSPVMADQIIADGQADIVAMGRSHLADPQLAEKAAHNRVEEIRPCIGCCLGCIDAVLKLEPGGCVVNPQVGREYQLSPAAPAARTKRIFVLGAGPGGLAAARTAAQAGHQVQLWDSDPCTGGAARLAAVPPGRGEIKDIIDYLTRELVRFGVPLHMNQTLSEAVLATQKPDAVVVACGSLPELPLIKGLFTTEMHLTTVLDVLRQSSPPGHRIIVIGGSQAGLLTADALAEQGKQVVVLNRKRHFAEEMARNDRFYLRERLKQNHVQLFKAVAIKRFLPDGVIFHCYNERRTLQGFDTVVVAEAMVPVRKPAETLKRLGLKFHIIGDAKSPRGIMHAISEGEELAWVL